MSGWRASVLWPVDINRPLNNPWVLKYPPPASEELPKATPGEENTPDILPTPRGGGELRKRLDMCQGTINRRLESACVKRQRHWTKKQKKKKNVELGMARIEERL